jgi:hypothetical protein
MTSLIQCSKCLKHKSPDQFYKNKQKINGHESQCKECVLFRKARKYNVKKQIEKKTKCLRLLKRVNVLEPSSCTLNEIWINRPASKYRDETIKKIFEEFM